MNIHDYTILNQLGKTDKRKFSKVFLVEHIQTHEKFVLKHVSKNSNNKVIQERLSAEKEFNFSVKGLPQTVDFFETENEIFLFRTFQKGIPIDEYLKKYSGKKRAEFLVQIALKLAVLLDHIHSNSIYHLDLKPSNLLIHEQNGELDVSIIDFGLALNKKTKENRTTLFPLGFAAPELVLNKLSMVDHRTDYFALGVTFWTCLQGQIPLIHANPSVTTNLQLTLPLPDLNYPFSKLSSSIQKLAAKYSFQIPPNRLKDHELEDCLKSGMNLRYNQFSEFIDDFTKATNSIKKYGLF